MANEYDDFSFKKANFEIFVNAEQSLSNDIFDFIKKIEIFNKKQIKTEDLERLKQYGHRENLEIHGIPFTQNKKTNEIVKEANVLKVKLEDKDISTSQRIFNDSKLSSRFGQFETRNSKHPSIIARFTNTEKRNKTIM